MKTKVRQRMTRAAMKNILSPADRRLEQVLGLMRDRFAAQGWVSVLAIREAALGLRPVVDAHLVDGALLSLKAMGLVDRRVCEMTPAIAEIDRQTEAKRAIWKAVLERPNSTSRQIARANHELDRLSGVNREEWRLVV